MSFTPNISGRNVFQIPLPQEILQQLMRIGAQIEVVAADTAPGFLSQNNIPFHPIVLGAMNQQTQSNHLEKLNIGGHSQSIALLFLRKYEVFPLPQENEFLIAKEALRECLEQGQFQGCSFKDTVLYLALLVEIAKESPELTIQIREFIRLVLQDHPKQLINQIRKIEFQNLSSAEKNKLRNVAKSYYQVVFKYLSQIFYYLPPSVKGIIESSFFISVGNQASAININPLVVFLHINPLQLSSINTNNLNIHMLFNSPNNPFFKSDFCCPISREGVEVLNYFSDFCKMPPIEFFIYAKDHPFFKLFIEQHLSDLKSFINKEEIITYLDYSREYSDVSRMIINSLNSDSSYIRIRTLFSDLKTLAILKFLEDDRTLIQKLVNNFDFNRLEVTFDVFKKMQADKDTLIDLKVSTLAIELPIECSSVDGDEARKQQFLAELVHISSHECILPLLDKDSFDINFIHSLFTTCPSLTTLNLGRLVVDEEVLKIALHQQIQTLILPLDNKLSSLKVLKKSTNLKEIFFEEIEKSDFQTSIKNFKMIGELSSWRLQQGFGGISSYCHIQSLITMIENPFFLEKFDDNVKILNCLKNLDLLKLKLVNNLLNNLSEEQYFLILQQPYLAFTWLPLHIEKITNQTFPYFENLVASLQVWMKSSQRGEYPPGFNEKVINDLFILLQAKPQLLKEALPFWVEFTEKVLIPQGFCQDLATLIILEIEPEDLDQQKGIVGSLKNSMASTLPSEKFLEAIFYLPWVTKHTKTACGLIERFSQHPVFLEANQGVLQKKVWEILSYRAKKGFVNEKLELGFASSVLIEELNNHIVTAYPAIAAKALYRLITANSPDQKEQLLNFFGIVITNPKAEEAFTRVLNTTTRSSIVEEARVTLLLKELTGKYRQLIIEHQKSTLGLLLIAPNSNSFSKELIEKWYDLFALLTKKNGLDGFHFNFFSTNPVFTEQLIPHIRAEKSEIFFKYFIPYAKSFFDFLCQNGQEGDLDYFLTLFLKKNWFPPTEEPFISDSRVLKKITNHLIASEATLVSQNWAREILKRPFDLESPFEEEEQTIYIELLNSLVETNIKYVQNFTISQCLNLGANPYILREWLRVCAKNPVYDTYRFAIALCCTTISFPKQALGNDLYEECLLLVMTIYETIVHREDADEYINQAITVFKNQLSRDEALIQHLLKKCFSVENCKVVPSYPALAAA
ncbi:MAG TPA: hypothetical protein VIH61_06200, partial [Waddliaceae bacterium]